MKIICSLKLISGVERCWYTWYTVDCNFTTRSFREFVSWACLCILVERFSPFQCITTWLQYLRWDMKLKDTERIVSTKNILVLFVNTMTAYFRNCLHQRSYHRNPIFDMHQIVCLQEVLHQREAVEAVDTADAYLTLLRWHFTGIFSNRFTWITFRYVTV